LHEGCAIESQTIVESKPESSTRARAHDFEPVQTTAGALPDTQAQASPLQTDPLLYMQRMIGNRAVRGAVRSTVLQPKLTIDTRNDVYEREVDHVDEQENPSAGSALLRGGSSGANDGGSESNGAGSTTIPHPATGTGLRCLPLAALQRSIGNRAVARLLQQAIPIPSSPEMRRKCACGGESEEECAECHASRLTVQRQAIGADTGSEAPSTVDELLRTPGLPLADSARKTLEPGFGHEFIQLRIHDDSKAAASDSAVNALAYTVGNHIVLGAGEYALGTKDGNHVLAHELTHTNQRTGRTSLGNDSDCKKQSAAPGTGQGAGGDTGIAAQRASSDGDASLEHVARGVDSAVVARDDSVGRAVDSGAPAAAGVSAPVEADKAMSTHQGVVQRYSWDQFVGDVKGVAGDVGSAVASAGQAVVAAGEAAVSWIETEAGKAALAGARAIAGALGGTVTPSGTGIEITIPDVEIAEVEDESFVLPLGVPTSPLFEEGLEIGPFVLAAYAGTIIGDPEVTVGIGPVKLQNIKLLLDPLAGTYVGTAQLYIGSALVGSGQKATEARVEAAGAIPVEPPVPIVASGELGLRTILRLVAKEGFTETVTIGYSGGSFLFHADVNVALAALAQLDREAFLRVEIETEEICSVIWPISSRRLGEAGIDVNVPVTLAKGPGGSIAKIGKVTASPIPASAIPTVLQDDHEPEHCMDLKELVQFLCKKGIVPAAFCCALPGTTPATGPTVAPPSGTPVVPPPGSPIPPGGCGGGTIPSIAASARTGRTRSDPIEMQWYKTDEHYDTPILLGGRRYHRKKPGQQLPPPDQQKEIGVEGQYLPELDKILVLAFEPDAGNKERFKTVLARHGYGGFKGAGTDADHNQDLQWAGPDEFYNLWPMDFRTNRSAGELQNNSQEITFSDRPGDPPQTMTLREFKRLGLHRDHKYFIIKRIFF
jgi:hypothetical protein